MSFELHPNFAKKIFITDLPLCRVLLEDDKNYPWIMLIPRRADKSRIMDLAAADQLLLLQELDLTQKILWNYYKPEQLNVAAIGNKTPQLHIHVIARNTQDPAWPGTVWDHPVKEKYSNEKREETVKIVKALFDKNR